MRRDCPAKVKAAAFERAAGCCEAIKADGARCGLKLQVGRYRYDHILPDWLGGEPTIDNCCVQCSACDTPKTASDQTRIAKTKRQKLAHIGARPSSRMAGSRSSPFKKKMNGQTVLRAPGGER